MEAVISAAPFDSLSSDMPQSLDIDFLFDYNVWEPDIWMNQTVEDKRWVCRIPAERRR